MAMITVTLGVVEGYRSVLFKWEMSQVPREGEILKYEGRSYYIVQVEWCAPSDDVNLTVLKAGW